MKLQFSNFGKFVQVLCWPIVVALGQFFIVAILSFFFMQGQLNDLKKIYPYESEEQIIERLNQLELEEPLNAYIESHMIYVFGFNILLTVFFIKKYHKFHIQKKNYPVKKLPKLILAAITFCILFHIILIFLGMRYQVNSNVSFWIFVIFEGVIGPILEEYLFRGIIYHKLKDIYPIKTAMILCTAIFALFHGNLLNIVFALLLGGILIILYEKYHNIYVPCLFHILVNLTSLLLVPFLQNIHFIFMITLCIVAIYILYYFLKDDIVKS